MRTHPKNVLSLLIHKYSDAQVFTATMAWIHYDLHNRSPAVAAANGKIYAIGGDRISEVNFYRARYESHVKKI